MIRVLLAAVGVATYTGCAGWVARRPRNAVAAGVALAAGVAALATSASPPDLRATLAIHAAMGAALVATAVLAERRRARPAGPAPTLALVRHWRGEVSLGRAVANASLLAAAAFWTAAWLDAAPLYPLVRIVAGAVVLASALLVAGGVWALVGVWRAADARARRGRGRALGWTARLATVPAWILLAGYVAFEVPDDMREYGPVAIGPAERGRYTLRVLRGGTELELSGAFAYGLGDDLSRALEANPGVRVLHLSSGGGRTFEAERVAALVRERKLTTYVASRCASACARAFAAGEERLVSRHAALGLHAISGHDLGPRELDRSTRRIVDALAARGIDRRFLERGFATPAGEMWWPTVDEALAAGLATRRAGAGEVALSGATEEDLERLPLRLREEPFEQALFEFERPLFDRIVTAMRDGYRLGQTELEALDFLGPEMERLLAATLPHASDRAARGLFEATLRLARAAQSRDAALCAALLAGAAKPAATADAGALLDGDGMAAAIANVIVSSHLDRRDPPAEDEVTPALVALFGRVVRRGVRVAALEGVEGVPPEEACGAGIAFVEEIVALPDRAAGPLVRFLASR